jgi:hypothetical protein
VEWSAEECSGMGNVVLAVARRGKGGGIWGAWSHSQSTEPTILRTCSVTIRGIIPLSIDLHTWHLYIGRRSSLMGMKSADRC